MNELGMRSFYGIRQNPPEEYKKDGMTTPDGIDYEGVVWSDGTCAVRWRTKYRSVTIWDSFEDFFKVHGHSEYGSRIVWM